MIATHSLERTNAKGLNFVGRCTQCGKTDLTSADMGEPCPNPHGVEADDAVVQAIIGPGDEGL